jgi:short-subunit dehydrogenase
LTKLFLKKMLQNKSGKILNMSSGVGFVPSPWLSVYGGTKHYILGFSNAIANELKGTGVSVTCFCPSVTKTLFHRRAGAEQTKALKSRMLVMDAATAARLGYRALEKGKTTAAAGLPLSLMLFAVRFVPRNLLCSFSEASNQPG